MCGIIGYLGARSAVPVIIEGLRKLEYRGYDSAGVAVVADSGKLDVRRAIGKLRNLEDAIQVHPIAGQIGIGHTRWATHGRPSEENAHPHVGPGNRVAVVHNGIIENYLAPRQELEQRGHTFTTEADTEVSAQLIEAYLEDDLTIAVRRTLQRIQGSFAISAISVEEPHKI